MANNDSQQSGSGPPSKPWERGGTSSSTLFKPSSPGSTSDVVEASGTAKPGEIVATNGASTMNTNAIGMVVPSRPWMQQNTYGGGGLSYNSEYGTGTYGSYGGSYNTGLYGSSMYGGGYGGLYGGVGMYSGGEMYNNSFGGPMGGYGRGMGGPGGPFGDQDSNNPFGAPSSPPGFWISLMRVMHGVVTLFGRVAMLIDQNTQAFHMFMSALLQLFDWSGLLYGELARFVFRLLGVRTRRKKLQTHGPKEPRGPHNYIEPPKGTLESSWDGVWGTNTQN